MLSPSCYGNNKGIWEFCTEDRHFTFSKVLFWGAIDRDSDGNPESVTAVETGETAEGATWTRVIEMKDADSDGTVDRLTAYEVAEDEVRKYVGAAEQRPDWHFVFAGPVQPSYLDGSLIARLRGLNLALCVTPCNILLDINLIDTAVGEVGRWAYALRPLIFRAALTSAAVFTVLTMMSASSGVPPTKLATRRLGAILAPSGGRTPKV